MLYALRWPFCMVRKGYRISNFAAEAAASDCEGGHCSKHVVICCRRLCEKLTLRYVTMILER